MSVLFVSDLHLDADRPAAIDTFVDFIEREGVKSERFFILGDLFEVWVGDDDDDPAMARVIDAIAQLRHYEVPCYVMHGNRDFLLGDAFAQRTGAKILTDYVTVDIYGQALLLTHGDLLCTDDTAYMKLRATVRDPQWQSNFLARPIEERRQIAASLRERSKTETAMKSGEIMDVNQSAVEETLRSHGVNLLVHGHTHRPGVHRFDIDGKPATRIVLGDWYTQGTILQWDRHGFKLRTLLDENA
ncbi:MAG: UDP-2,3-diacylglucosamine diphosphatase [Gammaproteobacteria bacterium]